MQGKSSYSIMIWVLQQEGVPLRSCCRSGCSCSGTSSGNFRRGGTNDGADDLGGAGVFALDSVDQCFVESCADGTGGKACACDLAHDAADDRMHGDLSSASVVLHVVGETEYLFTENGGKFLPLLDLLFVKDSVELVECILCVTAEGRDILRRILPYVDGSRCNGNFYCTKCIALRILFLLLLQFLPSEAFFQHLRYFIQISDDIPSLTVLCCFETPFFTFFSSSPQL